MASSSDHSKAALDSLEYQQLMRPHQPLGLSGSPHLQFYRPLGAQSLAVIDPSIFSAGEASPVQAFLEPFQDNDLFQEAVKPQKQSIAQSSGRSGDIKPNVNLSNSSFASIQRQIEAPEALSSASTEALGDIGPHARLEDSIAQTEPSPTDEGSPGEFPSYIQPQLESIPTPSIDSTTTDIGQFAKNDVPISTNSVAQTIQSKSEASLPIVLPELSASEPTIAAFDDSDIQLDSVSATPIEAEPIEASSSPIQRQSLEITEALPIPSQNSVEPSSSLIQSQSADKIEVQSASVRVPAVQAQLNKTADKASIESSELSTDSIIDSLPTSDQLQPDEPHIQQFQTIQPQTIQPQMADPHSIQRQIEAPEAPSSKPSAEESQAEQPQSKTPQSEPFLNEERSVEAISDAESYARLEDSIAQTKPFPSDEGSPGEFPSYIQPQLEAIPTPSIDSAETEISQFVKNDVPIATNSATQTIQSKSEASLPIVIPELSASEPTIAAFDDSDIQLNDVSAPPIEASSSPIQRQSIETTETLPIPSQNVESSKFSSKTDSIVNSLPTSDQLQPDEPQFIQQSQTIQLQTIQPQMAAPDSIQRQIEDPPSRPSAEESQAEQPQSEPFLNEERSVEAISDAEPHAGLEDSIVQTKPFPTDEGSPGEFPSYIQPQLEAIPTPSIDSAETEISQSVKNDVPIVTNSAAQTIQPKSEASLGTIIPELSASEPTIAAFDDSDVKPIDASVNLVQSEPIEASSPSIQRQPIETTEALPIPSQNSVESSSSSIQSQIADKIEVQSASVRVPAVQARLNETADKASVESSELSTDSTIDSLPPIDQLQPDEPQLIQQPETIQAQTIQPQIDEPQTDEPQAIQFQRHESLTASPALNEFHTVQLQADLFEPDNLQLNRLDNQISSAIEPDMPTVENKVPEIQSDATNPIVNPSVNPVPQLLANNLEPIKPDTTSTTQSTNVSTGSERSQMIESASSIPEIQTKSNSSTIQTSESTDLSVRPTAPPFHQPSTQQVDIQDRSLEPSIAKSPEESRVDAIDLPIVTDSTPNIQAQSDTSQSDSAGYNSSDVPDPSLAPQTTFPTSESSPNALAAEPITSIDPTQASEVQSQSIQLQAVPVAFSTPSLESQPQEAQSSGPTLASNVQGQFDSVDSPQLDATSPETHSPTSANPSLETQSQSAFSNSYPEEFVTESIESNTPTQLPEIQSQQMQTQENLPQNNLDSVIHSQAITAPDSSEANPSSEVVSPSEIVPIQRSIEVSETPITKTEQPTIQKSAVSVSEGLEKTSIPEVAASEPLKPVITEPEASATATESIDSSVDPRAPIAQLPTVLQNLTVLQPLNSPTIATKLQTPPQNTPEPMLPTNRLPPQHFQNEDAATALPSNNHWPDTRSDQISNSFVPSSFSSESPAHSQPPASDWQESPYSDLHPYEIPQPTIQAKPADIQTELQAESPESVNHSTSEHEAASQSGNPQSSTQNTDNASQSADKLEHLAQAMYRLLRQRLALERERSGNSYAGRLPW
jgi:hypothetical protein